MSSLLSCTSQCPNRHDRRRRHRHSASAEEARVKCSNKSTILLLIVPARMRQAAHLFSHTLIPYLAQGSPQYLQKTTLLSHGCEIKPTHFILHKCQPLRILNSLLSFSPSAPPIGHEIVQLTCCQLTAHKAISPYTSMCSHPQHFA
ncbi:unnamed protein product [Schistocephalus solidus]|uniref:Uncharacterized protein n=1 Tax=Schistocephalus solidus TaxID=70667 RepID=A0A183TUE8_SCHSO|nr:unnamed protein product [Schistocephalus solidus]